MSTFAYPAGLLPGDGLWAYLQPCPDPNRPLELRQLSVLLPPTAVFPGDAANAAPFLLLPGPMGQVQVTPHVSEATVQHAMGDSSFPDDPTAVLKWAHRAALPSLPTAPAVAAALQAGLGATNALQFATPKPLHAAQKRAAKASAASPYATPVVPSAARKAAKKAPGRHAASLRLPPLPPATAAQLQGLHIQQRSKATVLATRDVSPCVAHGISVSVPPGSGVAGGSGATPTANPSALHKGGIGGSDIATAGALGVPPTGVGFVIQKLVRCRGASPFIVRALWRQEQRRGGAGAAGTAPPSAAWVLSSTARYSEFALSELASALTAASRAEDAASSATGTTAFLASMGGAPSTTHGAKRPAADSKTLRRMFRERLQSVLLVDTCAPGEAEATVLPAAAAGLLLPAPRGAKQSTAPPLSISSAALAPFAPPAVPTLRLQKLSPQGSAEVLALTGSVAAHISAASGLHLAELMVDWTRDEDGRWWMLAPKAYRVQGGLHALHRAAQHPPRPPSTAHIPAAKALWKAHSERLLAMGGQRSTWRKGVKGGREAAPAGRSGEARLKQLSLLAQAEGREAADNGQSGDTDVPSDATSALALREQSRAEHNKRRQRRGFRGPQHGAPHGNLTQHGATMAQLHGAVGNAWAHAPHAPLLSSSSSDSDSSSVGGDITPHALPSQRSLEGAPPPQAAAVFKPHYSADVALATRSAHRAWAQAASEAIKSNRLHMQGLLRGQAPGGGEGAPLRAAGASTAFSASVGTMGTLGGTSTGVRSAVWGRHGPPSASATSVLSASPGSSSAAVSRIPGGTVSLRSTAPRSRRAALAAGVDAASTVQYGTMMAGNVLQEHMPPLELTPPGQAFSATGGMAADVHTSGLRSKRKPPSKLSRAGVPPPGEDSDSEASGVRQSTDRNTRMVEYSQVDDSGKHTSGGSFADAVGVSEPHLGGRPPRVQTAIGGGGWSQKAPLGGSHGESVQLGMQRPARNSSVVEVKADALGAARQHGIPSAGGVQAQAAAESDAVETAMQHLMQDRSAVHRVPASEAEQTREGSTVIAVVSRDKADAQAELDRALKGGGGTTPWGRGATTPKAEKPRQLFSVGESTLSAVRRLADGIQAAVQGGAFAKNDQALRLFAASGMSDLGGNEATRIMARAQLQAVHTHLMGQLSRSRGRRRDVQWAHAPHVDASGHVDPADVTTSAGERATHPCTCCSSRLPSHKLPFALTAAQLGWLCMRLARRLPPAAVRQLQWLQRHLTAAGARQPPNTGDANHVPTAAMPALPLSQGGFPDGGAAVLQSPSRAEDTCLCVSGVLLEGDFAQTAVFDAETDIGAASQSVAPKEPPLLLLAEARRAASAASAPAGSTAVQGENTVSASSSGAIASRYELLPVCALCYELHEREVAITRTEAALAGSLGLRRTLQGYTPPPKATKDARNTPMTDTAHAFVRVLIALDGVQQLPLRELLSMPAAQLDALAPAKPGAKDGAAPPSPAFMGTPVADTAEARLGAREAELRSRLCRLQCKHAEFGLRHAAVRLVAVRRRLQRAAGIVRSGGDLVMWWNHQRRAAAAASDTKGLEGSQASPETSDAAQLPAATLTALQLPDERAAALASLHLNTVQLLDETWPHVQEVLLGLTQGGTEGGLFGALPAPPDYMPGGHHNVTLRGSAVGRRHAAPAQSKGVVGLLRMLAERGCAPDSPEIAIVRGWQSDLQHAAQLVNTLERSWASAQSAAMVAAAGAAHAAMRVQAQEHKQRFRGAFLRITLWDHQWDLPLSIGSSILQAAASTPQSGSNAAGLAVPQSIDVSQRQLLCLHALAPDTRVNVDISKASSRCGLSRALNAQDELRVQLHVAYWGEGGWRAAPVASCTVSLAAHRYQRVPFASHSQPFKQLRPKQQRLQPVASAAELHPFVAGLVQGGVDEHGGGQRKQGRRHRKAPPTEAAPVRGQAMLEAARASAAARARARRRQHAVQLRLPGGTSKRVSADGVQPDLRGGGADQLESKTDHEHARRWSSIPGGAAALHREAVWGSTLADGSSSDSEAALSSARQHESATAANSSQMAWSACRLHMTTGIQVVRDDIVPLVVDASLTPPSDGLGGESLLSPVAARSGEDTDLGHMPPAWAGWVWHAHLGVFLPTRASAVRGWGAAPMPPSWCKQLPAPLAQTVAAVQAVHEAAPYFVAPQGFLSTGEFPGSAPSDNELGEEQAAPLLQYPVSRRGDDTEARTQSETQHQVWSGHNLRRIVQPAASSSGWVQLAPGHRVPAALLAAQALLAASGCHTATAASILRQAVTLHQPISQAVVSPGGRSPSAVSPGGRSPSVASALLMQSPSSPAASRRRSSATSHGRRRVSLHDVHTDILAAVQHAKTAGGDAALAGGDTALAGGDSSPQRAPAAAAAERSLPLEERLVRHLAALSSAVSGIEDGYCTWHVELQVLGMRGPRQSMQRLLAMCGAHSEGSQGGLSDSSRGLLAGGGSATGASTRTPRARTGGTLSPGAGPHGGMHFPPRTPTLSPKRGHRATSPVTTGHASPVSAGGESFVALVRRMVAMRQGLRHWVRGRRQAAAEQEQMEPPELRLPGHSGSELSLQASASDLQQRRAASSGLGRRMLRPGSPGARSAGGDGWGKTQEASHLRSVSSVGTLQLPRVGSSSSGFGALASHRSSDKGGQGVLKSKASAAVLRVLEEADSSDDGDGDGGVGLGALKGGVVSLSSGPLHVDALLARYGISAEAAEAATSDGLQLDARGSLVPVTPTHKGNQATAVSAAASAHVSLRGHRNTSYPNSASAERPVGVTLSLCWGEHRQSIQLHLAPLENDGAVPEFRCPQQSSSSGAQARFQVHGTAEEAAHVLSRAHDAQGGHVQLQLLADKEEHGASPRAPLSEEVSLPLGHAALETGPGMPAEWSAMLERGGERGALAGVYVYGKLQVSAEAP